MAESFDTIVIGGGPAGSTVATFLARMGHRVLVLEREVFPRHHVGESMIAATIDLLGEIGLEEPLAHAGFPIKAGGCFSWGESPEPWCIRFDELPGRSTSYQVERSRFDQILLEHAAASGVDVRQGQAVTEVLVEAGRVTGVRFTGGEAHAPYTVDASGLAAVVANRLSQRIAADDLRNFCLYGYWSGEHPPPSGLGGEIRPTDHDNIVVKMLDDGWLWFIPLGHARSSVGFVAPREALGTRSGKAGLERLYLDRVHSTAEWEYLLGASEYTGEFHTASDWSYRSREMAGAGYFAVGDAACFVDPILSSGVYLAVLFAKMAALAVNTLLRSPTREPLVADWYESLYVDAYTDYVDLARFWYHGRRRADSWMDAAREAVDGPVSSARAAFVGLAAGNVHADPGYRPVRTLPSFPLPLQLRKDARGHYLRDAQAALVRHAGRDRAPANEPDGHAKRLAEALRVGTAGVSARLTATMADRPARDDDIRVSEQARFSLEAIDDVVTMVVRAPNGERRALTGAAEDVVAWVAGVRSISRVALATGLPLGEVEAWCTELVQAGVFTRASG